MALENGLFIHTAHTTALQVSLASTQGFNPDLKNLKSSFLDSLINAYSLEKAAN